MIYKSKIIAALVVITVVMTAAVLGPDKKFISISYPKSWPKPVYDFSKSPLEIAKVELGRHLFYDPILSLDSSISCSSCHLSFTAFTHVDHALSHGIGDSIGTRNSPVIFNLAWSKELMWDGAVNHIDVQALAPINHPLEMGESTEHVLMKLNRNDFYKQRFKAIYKSSVIGSKELLSALAQFQLSLVSCGSKYDRYMAGDKKAEFSEQEKRGLILFRKHCSSCHPEPLFTTGEFANNGLAMDTVLKDIGRMRITLQKTDSLKFKIPTLRNIEFSFPYMHDGRFKSLNEVLNHYRKGIHESSTLAPELRGGVFISPEEKTDIVAFLLTLSDRSFLLDPKHAFPKN